MANALTPAILVADAIAIINAFGGPQWGVFLDGAPAFDYASIFTFEYRQEWPVSDYPVEDGAFQSYDKVELPFDVRVRVISGPSVAQRQAMIDTLEDISGSLELYDVATPEKVYVSCNVTHVDYRRSAEHSLGVIVADVWFTQIRVSASTTFSNTQQPSAQGTTSLGVQQAQPLSGDKYKAIAIQPSAVQ